MPKVAWAWYVIIGALVTFAVGLLASVVFRARTARRAIATAALLALSASSPFLLSFRSVAQEPASPEQETPTSAQPQSVPDFSAVSAAIDTAIAQKKLPGAVVVIGHGGKVVFEQAYGLRKLAGEPGLDGKLSAAEPMTLDTIFDMASMTKVMATSVAIMQLYEAGKLILDAPVAKYLPEFAANGKQAVTIRELLTHYSGLPPDVDLKDAWGLAAPDKPEGVRRALQSPLTTTPGTHFEYSDINYIILGALVEKLSGERLDDYAYNHIFRPLVMVHTGFNNPARSCYDPPYGSRKWILLRQGARFDCAMNYLRPSAAYPLEKVAPTAHDDQGTAATNPDFDHLLRGTVHDPTTRRMGGVAGQAGVFSTADDVALFAQALLDRLAGRPSNFPLKRETLELMTTPQQPKTAESGATIFTQDGTTTTGVAQRGFGWDINSAYSRPRGGVFPTAGAERLASFGHTGFTGTSLWIDPTSDTYVILLANSVHPRGNPPISALRGEVATDVAKALGLESPTHRDEAAMNGAPGPSTGSHVLTGIDVLEATDFAALKEAAARNGGRLRIGLLTNQTGVDAQGRRTIDVLRGIGGGIELTTLFSPEHGIFGAKDSTNIGPEVDPVSGLKVISLYGAKDEDRRPKPEDLKNLDAVVIDLQDAGVRFYTYETVVGYFLEADACERAHVHDLEVILLDRPALIGGDAVQGPVSRTPPSYINYMQLPLRHGMTLGELARYMQGERTASCDASAKKDELSEHAKDIPQRLKPPCNCSADGTAEAVPLNKTETTRQGLTVVPMQNWRRDEFFDATGVAWVNPSPNLRSVAEAVLYPGLGMLDATNVSVGRGTATPFEVFGAGATAATKDSPAQASWFDGKAVADYLTERRIPGVEFAATRFAVTDDANHYPYHGQTIEGVRLIVAARAALDSPELGIEILSALHHLYPTQFKLDKAAPLVANAETMAALKRGDDPRAIAAGWVQGLADFKARREKYLIYH